MILVWFGLVEFYGISTIVGYLMPNPVFTYILNNTFCKNTVQWSNSFFLTIQLGLSHLFGHNLDIKTVLLNPQIGPYQVRPLQTRMDHRVMAVKGYSAFPKAPAFIIIMSCRQHGYPWPSLATSPYHSSLLAGLQGYILYPHIAAVCMFELVVLLLLGHMRGSIRVHHRWVRPCFSSSVLRVWFV